MSKIINDKISSSDLHEQSEGVRMFMRFIKKNPNLDSNQDHLLKLAEVMCGTLEKYGMSLEWQSITLSYLDNFQNLQSFYCYKEQSIYPFELKLAETSLISEKFKKSKLLQVLLKLCTSSMMSIKNESLNLIQMIIEKDDFEVNWILFFNIAEKEIEENNRNTQAVDFILEIFEKFKCDSGCDLVNKIISNGGDYMKDCVIPAIFCKRINVNLLLRYLEKEIDAKSLCNALNIIHNLKISYGEIYKGLQNIGLDSKIKKLETNVMEPYIVKSLFVISKNEDFLRKYLKIKDHSFQKVAYECGIEIM